MSALGYQRTYAPQQAMSALHPIATTKADIIRHRSTTSRRGKVGADDRYELGRGQHRLSALTPKDPEFEARVRASFAKQGLMKTIGAHLTRVLPGAVDIELPLSPAVSQQAGIAHGAALVAIADSAMGYAAFSLMPPGADTATIELKINYLAPAVGDRMVARGRVVKAGRRTIVTQADVFAETAGREKLVGLVTATFINGTGREDI